MLPKAKIIIVIIIKRISSAHIYCTRWEHRALYNNTNINNTHLHHPPLPPAHTHTHTYTCKHTSDGGIGMAVKKTVNAHFELSQIYKVNPMQIYVKHTHTHRHTHTHTHTHTYICIHKHHIHTHTHTQASLTHLMMMSWCLMSSDVIWHIRDKLWPMPKHGSIKSTYVRCMRV